ncbi:hypothetical protein SAMN06272735_7192 [Streptomyces sp. TLI_55]|uniref:hypothetical protein n=1 Tax=Streptomyces sp. TLI_55 TaxID=1938861 RepID=UPI000BD12A68|nr:hypothetical protein [Streptomyces sp. TLI_55]SNX65355.1 hypothetical protein SAMN06272735_7192 [Streptomyces sp. TLI_55]
MRGVLIQAGQRLLVDCRWPPLSPLLIEAGADAWRPAGKGAADVYLEAQAGHTPFDVRGWETLARDAFVRDGAVVLRNACGSGFDLLLATDVDRLRVVARWRPPVKERAAAHLLRSRFHLLARATLLQYPALWWAGCRDFTPLHASALTIGPAGASRARARCPTVLLVGPGGTGRSTLLLGAVTGGGRSCSDNLGVTDGRVVHGLVEPMRVRGGGGRRMAHGRTEQPLPGRVDSLCPDRLVVLRRISRGRPEVRALDAAQAARALVAATYAAGELRRYWPFAAVMALGTGLGPPHPPITKTASRITERLPAYEIVLGDRPEEGLAALYDVAARGPEQMEALP